MERDRLLIFINRLLSHRKNVKEFLDANGVKILVDLLTLAHLHTTRATVPMQVSMRSNIRGSNGGKILGLGVVSLIPFVGTFNNLLLTSSVESILF